MSLKKFAIAALALVALSALAGDAVTAVPVKTDPAKGPATATFAVPNLADAATVKGLNGALAKEAGVLSAKADAAGGKFLVTFDPAKTTAEALGKALATVAPEAKFENVQAADASAAKHDCSKCPSKSSCGKHK